MGQSIAALMTNGAIGGISDDKFLGIANSFQHIENLEIRKHPKQVELNKKLVKDSGDVVVDKINCALTISDTGTILAFGDAGNIYIKSLGGTRQKVFTHTAGYAILGCIEYNQYIYRATLDKLHRTDLTSIDTAISSGTLTPTDEDRQILNGITYSNGLQVSYDEDYNTKNKVGMKIYAKKSYNLTDVGVSAGTTAPTKAYLDRAYPLASIAGSTERLYTTTEIDTLTGNPVWTERRPLGDVDKDWKAMDVSVDGLKMAVANNGGDLQLSTDGGVNWSEKTTGTPLQLTDTWTLGSSGFAGGGTFYGVKFRVDVDCKLKSSTGTRLYSEAGVQLADGAAIVDYELSAGTIYRLEFNQGGFYTTTTTTTITNKHITFLGGSELGSDGAVRVREFNIETLADNANIRHISMSQDGSTIIASQGNGRVYLSTDTGANRTERKPAGDANKDRRIIKVSGDGTKYLAGVYGGRLYTSSNGTDWTERRPAGDADKNWISGQINYDGTRLMVADYGGRLRVSNDSGATWAETRPAGDANKNRTLCDMSNNYQCMIASIGTTTYATIDYGDTWYNTSLTGTVSSVGVDFGGLTFTATNGTRAYKSVDGGNNRTELQPAGNNNKVRNKLAISDGATPIETVAVAAEKATFSSTLSADTYYYLTFDKEGASRDPSRKVTSFPITKTDINYITGLRPITANYSYVITSIGTTVVQDIAHPMITGNGVLYIGDGQYVATVDPVGAYVADTLRLADMDKIYDITYNNAYLRIYCIQGTNTDVGIAYFWDGVQDAPDQRQELPGKFRNVTMRDNVDYAIMGTVDPILYYYPYQRQILKRIDNFSNSIKSMLTYKNYLLFGCKGGVYSWGNFNKDYPEVLTLERRTSNNNETDDIGCIWNSNGELYVAWKDGTDYGVDKLSTTAYYNQGYLVSRVYYGKQMRKRKDNTEVYVTHKPLIEGESIKVYTKKNLTGDRVLKYTMDHENGDGTHNTFLLQEEYNEIEFKIELNGTGTTTPEVYEFVLRHNEEEENGR